MILADTSIWIDHFRRGNLTLANLLEQVRVASHPHVVGELACGTLSRRVATIELLRALPASIVATDEEVLGLVEEHRIHGRGLGWTDVHLLAAARLSGHRLWTLDRRLAPVARELAVDHEP